MRLHAIVDTLDDAAFAVDNGATVIQLRLKGVGTIARVSAAAAIRPLAAMLVINDDVEAAIRCGADGVHLGQTDAGAERAMAAGLVLGISAGSLAEAEEAAGIGATYIGAGPVWATPSKADAGAPIGLRGLSAIAAAVRVPVVAIGGVDAGNAGSCIDAGAAGVAVVRAVRDTAAVRAAVDGALGRHRMPDRAVPPDAVRPA